MTAPTPLPPIEQLRERLAYDPLTGAITHRQPRGPRRAGEPAGARKGASEGGRRRVWVGGRHHRAADVAWALGYGQDPAAEGAWAVPLDGDHANLALSNLALSNTPPGRVQGIQRRRARRPSWQRSQIRYRQEEDVWVVRYRYPGGRRVFVGGYDTKALAIQAWREFHARQMLLQEQEQEQEQEEDIHA